jgi:hypothetical protein
MDQKSIYLNFFDSLQRFFPEGDEFRADEDFLFDEHSAEYGSAKREDRV